MTTGTLSVLNVGAGDIEVKFNQHNPDELARAIKMLQDMQARGYAILVREEDGSYVRAKAIDATRGLYIINEGPSPPDIDTPPLTAKRRGRPPGRTMPIASSHAVGVGRSAGG